MKAKSLSERLLIGRQIAAIATAFMIPVSTSGQAIAVSIFVLLVALTVKREEWLVTFATPAAAGSVCLYLLVFICMAWGPTPVPPRGGCGSYGKILLLPGWVVPPFPARGAGRTGVGVFWGRFGGP